MIRMQSLVCVASDTARRLHLLAEPIHLVNYFADEPDQALLALGLRNTWDAYLAARAASLSRVPAHGPVVVSFCLILSWFARCRIRRRRRYGHGDRGGRR